MKIAARVKNGIYLVSTRLFQFFIVLCLIGGFFDIMIPIVEHSTSVLTKKFTELQKPSQIEPGSVNDVIEKWPALPVFRMPGIEGVLKEHHSPGINISADGMRSNGQPIPQNVKSTVFLLGSSPAWGYRIADHQTLSAQLERNLVNTRVENYAGLAQNLAGNALRWYLLDKNNPKPDLVIISGASTDIGLNCYAQYNIQNGKNINYDSKNLYYNLYKKFISKNKEYDNFICDTKLNQEIAVKQSIIAVKNAVNFAREQGVPFYIVYLPTPYDGFSNNENLLNVGDFGTHLTTKQHVFSLYYKALLELDIPELIDLSQALPPDQVYFLDKGSHLSGNGNKILASKIADRIRKDYPSISE
ncbi:hypothetical protein [Thalassospira xiamenensis]|uniref:hypothetical protein n=1 Tax=Thalassospira xiamenensis TaxID=220697 RepID=UPI003AA7BE7A